MSKSYWESTNTVFRGRLAAPKDSDVLVIGSGFTGLSVAAELKDYYSVTIVDDGNSNSFSKNAGHMLVGLGESYNRIVESKGREVARDIYQFFIRAHEYMEKTTPVMRTGEYSVIPYNDTELHELYLSNKMLATDGFQPLTVNSTAHHPKVFTCPYSGSGNPLYYRRNLLWTSSLVPYERKVKEIRYLSIANYEVEYCDGTISKHNAVVMATNAYSKLLKTDLADKIEPFKGQIIVSQKLDYVPPPEMEAFSSEQGGLYGQFLKENTHTRLLIGGWRCHVKGKEVGSYDTTPNPEITKGLIEEALKLTGVEVTPEYEWCGIMGSTNNGLPIITQRASDGIFICAGMNGYGFGVGSYCGKIMADMVLGNSIPWVVSKHMRGDK